ncbi:hypothetical protein ACLK10_02560 [Escherichia coli]
MLNCNASFVFVPAKPTKRRCNLWHTATGTKNEDSDDKNWACFTGDAAGLVMAAPAVADKADNAFMMICTALVLFMTIPGIALFYGG